VKVGKIKSNILTLSQAGVKPHHTMPFTVLMRILAACIWPHIMIGKYIRMKDERIEGLRKKKADGFPLYIFMALSTWILGYAFQASLF
jgi:hypothetical protein